MPDMPNAGTIARAKEMAGTWVSDQGHSQAGFSAKHMMITTVRGRFDDFTATINLAKDPAQSAVEATFKTASINTGTPDRDTHLRSADFLDVENHPEMTFKSKAVELTSDTTARVVGDLTIRRETRPVTLDVAFNGYLPKDLFGGTRASFTATASLSRKEWDLTWNMALETGGVLVGDRVDITLEIAAVKQ